MYQQPPIRKLHKMSFLSKTNNCSYNVPTNKTYVVAPWCWGEVSSIFDGQI